MRAMFSEDPQSKRKPRPRQPCQAEPLFMETTQGLDNRAREEFRQQLRAEVAEALRR